MTANIPLYMSTRYSKKLDSWLDYQVWLDLKTVKIHLPMFRSSFNFEPHDSIPKPKFPDVLHPSTAVLDSSIRHKEWHCANHLALGERPNNDPDALLSVCLLESFKPDSSSSTGRLRNWAGRLHEIHSFWQSCDLVPASWFAGPVISLYLLILENVVLSALDKRLGF